MSDDSNGRVPRCARVHRTAATVTVTLSGDFDQMATSWAQDFITDFFDATTRHVVLDLAEVGFMDAAGPRALLHVHDTSTRNGITLTLRRPPPCVVWVLDTCGVTHLLINEDVAPQHRDEDQPRPTGASVPADITAAEPARHPTADERDRTADERDRTADERDQAADERDRVADERSRQVDNHQRWEDIREDRADQRERDLEQRERSDLP